MWFFLSRALWLPAIGAFLVVADPLAPAEFVLPLAGDLERVSYAAHLYRAGYARRLLLTKLPLATVSERSAHLEQVRSLAISQGVEPQDIVVVSPFAQTTFGEAQHVQAALERLQGQTLLVVTSPWHTRRSKLVFNAVFRNSRTQIRIVPVQGSSRRSLPAYVDSWWRGRSEAGATGSEYLKLVAYMFGIR